MTLRNTALILLFGLPSGAPCGPGTMLMQLAAGTVDMDLIQSDCCCSVIPSLGFLLKQQQSFLPSLWPNVRYQWKPAGTHKFGTADLIYRVVNEC